MRGFACAVCALIASASISHAQRQYEVQWVDGNFHTMFGPNDNGAVAGVSVFGSFVSQGDHVESVPHPRIKAINNLGHVIGDSSYLWNGTSLVYLQGANGHTVQEVTGLNDSDVVVGNVSDFDSQLRVTTRAAVWTRGIPEVIPVPNSERSWAVGIDNDGRVAIGATIGPTGQERGFVSMGGTLVDLGTLPAALGTEYVHPYAIAGGFVVGESRNLSGEIVPVRWHDGVLSALDIPFADSYAFGRARFVSASGLTLVEASSWITGADWFLYEPDGSHSRLLDLVPGLPAGSFIRNAGGINGRGAIGVELFTPDRHGMAILRNVPSPGAAWLCGLACTLSPRRRRGSWSSRNGACEPERLSAFFWQARVVDSANPGVTHPAARATFGCRDTSPSGAA